MPGTKSKLVVSVQDSGVGISTQDQQNLFKIFGTVKNTQKMNTQGIGLGLYICKQITQQFDGSISVKSEIGAGSRFTFYFLLN